MKLLTKEQILKADDMKTEVRNPRVGWPGYGKDDDRPGTRRF